MCAWSPQQIRLIRVLLLGVILVLALFMAGIPRWNYSYPIHSDEWKHYGDAQSLMETAKISYPDPCEAGSIFSPDIEVGFHLLLGELKHITGMSWVEIFRFLPGIILAILVFQVYAVTRRKWIGLSAAFLAALIPTTIRFLGPAFLVPVGLGLTFVPLSLFILRHQMKPWRGPVLLLVFLFCLLFVHPPTFIIISILAAVHLILYLFPGKGVKSRHRPIKVSLCGIGAIYIFGFFRASSYVAFNINEALIPQSEQSLPPIVDVIARFGYVLPFLFALGIGILAYRGTRKDWALVFSAIGLLAFQLVYSYFFIGPDIIYERGWLYLYILMAIIGGMALGDIRRWLRNIFKRRAVPGAVAGYGVIIALLVLSFIFSLRSHFAEPYYHLVNDIKYQDFIWVREYVPSTYRTGITDIGLACPFAAVSGKYVYIGEVSPHFRLKEPQASEFFKNGAADTPWLIKEGLSIVYTGKAVANEDLIKVSRNLYLLSIDTE